MKLFSFFLFIFFLSGCSSGGGSSVFLIDDRAENESLNVTFYESPQATSSIPLLVVLVDFNDQTIVDTDLAWSQKIFGNSAGQLNDYFAEISNNTFSFTPANESYNNNNDGIIKVTVNINHPNIADPNTFRTTVAAPALTAANPFIDFSVYDTNANTRIDKEELQVMFLVAGGELATLLTPGIWAHAYCLNGQSLDGVDVMQCNNGSYTAFGERHDDFGVAGSDATIGIIAHELGHGAFYLPDLYDTDLSSEGIGEFGLMGAGSWGFVGIEIQGTTPVHMSAFSKIESGFLTPRIITTDSNNMPLAATDRNDYRAIRVNTQDSDEYFLIENRSASGYDAGLYSLEYSNFLGGLAIWHINEAKDDNDDESNKLVDLEEADGFHLDTAGNKGSQTNLFYEGNNAPAYTGVLSSLSTPSTTNTSNNSPTGISVSNISAPASLIYIDLHF